ncbi:MAG: hypothetical protein QF662_06290, partial [Phycisphaerae bacterium]|nr:hypothetical protein [Phycisphaerae bacterium]
PEEFSLLDEGIVEKIALAYKRKVWVKEVLRIEKRYPDPRRWQSPIEVHLRFRRPIAFIELSGRFYLVDGEGIRLPGVYDRPRLGAEEMFVITGVRTRPPGPGRKWDAKSLRCGLTVASALRSRRVPFRLARIDVGNIGGRRDARLSEIAVYTGQDTRIDWGKPPSRRADILDKPLADKIAYLDYVYRQFGGRIDDDLVYVDIPNETVRRRPSPFVY